LLENTLHNWVRTRGVDKLNREEHNSSNKAERTSLES
jgi:hypothetical protein